VAGALVVLVLLAGLSVSLWQMFRAIDAEKQANQNAASTKHYFASARGLIAELASRIEGIETGTNRLPSHERKKTLDSAREQFEQFRTILPDDESVHKQTANLHRYAGNYSRVLGDYLAATDAYAAAINIYEELVTRFPNNPAYRDDLGQTLSDRASAEKRMGRLTEAAQTLQKALKLAEGGRSSLLESAYSRSLAIIENDLTDVFYRLGQFDEAARLARQARERLDGLKYISDSEKNPLDPLYGAMTVQRFAMSQRELGEMAVALTAHEDAVDRMKALNGPNANRDMRYWYCEVRRERARTLASVPERSEAASEDLLEVIGMMEKLVKENPEIPYYREGLAAALHWRAELLLLLKRAEPATSALEKSLTVSRELIDRFGNLSASLLVRGRTYLALGRARAAAGKTGEAAAEWKKAVTLFEMGLKADPDNFHHRRGLAEAKRSLDASKQ
jgi:tetratricopeptide (TPR) repeat protein